MNKGLCNTHVFTTLAIPSNKVSEDLVAPTLCTSSFKGLVSLSDSRKVCSIFHHFSQNFALHAGARKSVSLGTCFHKRILDLYIFLCQFLCFLTASNLILMNAI